jgi:hypothetical protein
VLSRRSGSRYGEGVFGVTFWGFRREILLSQNIQNLEEDIPPFLIPELEITGMLH